MSQEQQNQVLKSYKATELKQLKIHFPVPAWFDGFIIPEDEVIKNRFTGQEAVCNPIEVAIYDVINGAQLGLYALEKNVENPKEYEGVKNYYVSLMRKGLDWFRTYSPENYMILLD